MEHAFLLCPIALLPYLIGSYICAYRHHAAAERLCQAHDIRRHILILTGKHPAGPAESRLDLIRDKVCVIFGAQFPYSLEISFRRYYYTALSLNGLDDECSDSAFLQPVLQMLKISVGDRIAVGNKRPERLLIFLPAGH